MGTGRQPKSFSRERMRRERPGADESMRCWWRKRAAENKSLGSKAAIRFFWSWRGGALALATAAIPFEIVPGITSAIADCYAGIPVTHREKEFASYFFPDMKTRRRGKLD